MPAFQQTGGQGAPNFYSGRNARAVVNGVNTQTKKWVVNPKDPEIDVTNTESQGFGVYIGSIIDCDVTIEGDYFVGAPGVMAMNMAPGALVPVTIYQDFTDGAAGTWQFTQVYINSFENTSEVRGSISYRLTGKTSGVFSLSTLK